MKEEILKIIENLNNTIEDIEKVENKKYGFKSAAVRSRKVCQDAANKLKDIRKQIQIVKNMEE